MNKNDRRVRRTKQNIREAFFSLVEKKNIDLITVKELSEAADIDRKTFYAHYGTVYDVLEEFESEISKKILELVKTSPPMELGEHFMKGLTAVMEENIDFYRHVSADIAFSFVYNQCEEILRDAIIQYFPEDMRTERSYKIIKVYSDFIAAGICGVYTSWLVDNNNTSLDELVSLTSDCVEKAWSELVEVI